MQWHLTSKPAVPLYQYFFFRWAKLFPKPTIRRWDAITKKVPRRSLKKSTQVALTGAVLPLLPLVQALDPLWQSLRSLLSQSGSLPSPCTPCTTCTPSRTCTPSTTCTPAPPHCPLAPTHPLSSGSTPADLKRLPPPRDPQGPRRGRQLPRAGTVFDMFADDDIL